MSERDRSDDIRQRNDAGPDTTPDVTDITADAREDDLVDLDPQDSSDTPDDSETPTDATDSHADGSDANPDPPVDSPIDEDLGDSDPEVDGDATSEDLTDEPDTGPPPTPSPGSYQYDRLEIGDLNQTEAVVFHPDASYAIILEAYNEVHVYDLGAESGSRFDPSEAGVDLDWEDVVFDPSGDFALLLGSERTDSTQTGVIYRFDDSAWRAYDGEDDSGLFSAYDDLPAVSSYSALVYPKGEGAPALLAYNDLGFSNFSMSLRDFDPATGATTFLGTQATGDPCSDMAFANNDFGKPGLLITCNLSVLYYTVVDDDPEWTLNLGGFNTGNANSVTGYPGGQYALLVGWSGRRVFRFEDQDMAQSEDAPRFGNRDIWGVEFQQDGRRAIIYGGKMDISGLGSIGTVLEYRHDLYIHDEITDVSIINFDAPNSFDFRDAAWRPDCDGGLLVGGKSTFDTNIGWAVTFEIEGGVDCW